MKLIIASTAMCAIGNAAAFNFPSRIFAGPRGKIADIRRSMVAMEPEKAQRQNMAPPTNIMRPEELMREMEEANGFSEWQGTVNGKKKNGVSDPASGMPDEEMFLGEEEEIEDPSLGAGDEAIVGEVEEETSEEGAEAEESPKDDVLSSSDDKSENDINGEAKEDDQSDQSRSISEPVKNVAESVAKLNVVFRIMNRALVSIYIFLNIDTSLQFEI